MDNLKVDIYGNSIVCGERKLLCSVDTSLKGNKLVSIPNDYIDKIIENSDLTESQKLVLTKIKTLETLGNNRLIKPTDFDISCMKRLIDSIDEHPDFECLHADKKYTNKLMSSYTDLALVRNKDNRIMLKISRDSQDNVDYVYIANSKFGNKYNKFIDMIRFTGHNNGEIIDIFEQLEKMIEGSDESNYHFREISWDIIPIDAMKASNKIGIECSMGKLNELVSLFPLFRIEYTQLIGYYSVKGIKKLSVIENLLEEFEIDKSTADKINDFIEDDTVESFDDLIQDLTKMFGFENGMIFDIVPTEGPITSIDSDDYYFGYDEDEYEIGECDEYEYDEENKYDGDVNADIKGMALVRDLNTSSGLEDLIGYAFPINGRLYHRICDTFIHDLERKNSTTELGKELDKLNSREFKSIYDFKVNVEDILDKKEYRTPEHYKFRLEVLQDDVADVRMFNKLMSVTLINKRNNITAGKITYLKLSDESISVSKSVTINGYSSLHDDIREIVRDTISNQGSIRKYDSVKFNEMIKTLVSTDDIELIIVKDGKAMYIDSNTNIDYFDTSSIGYTSHENLKIYKGADKKWWEDEDEDNNKAEVSGKEKKVTFDDVVGMEQVKEKLYDVIDQFKNRSKYEKWGIKAIRGVLLHGPSGTGKSFISEALANEVDAHFVKKSSGDIMSKYVGQSGQNIKRIFDEARQNKGNTIIFIDEIDAIASKRSDEENKERNATLNELLVQMSSLDNENIFMIFATNLVELLDPAFLRSGRCDFKIEIPLPDFEMRKGILKKASSKRPLSDDVDFDMLSRNMSGMNCADVDHISNEAGRRAIKANKDKVEACDYEAAIEDMICGSSSKTTKLSEKEKTTTAYHEIGHFYMNYILDLRKAKKISILPRGSALGFVMYTNEKENDKFLYTKDELVNQIQTLLAGRAMEELFLENISTGAYDDLKKANKIARDIICKYGFNDSLLVLDDNDIMSRNNINKHVKELLDDCYANVKEVLKSERVLLKDLSEFLYKKEDVTGDELVEYMDSLKNEK